MLNVLTIFTLLLAPIPKGAELPPITEEMWKTSIERLKQIGLALHAYHDTHGEFPKNVVDKNGKALLSWRVVIVPYLEIPDDQKPDIKLDEAWDSKHNTKQLEKIPDAFKPVRAKPALGHTFYQGFSGKAAFFDPKNKVGMTNITDGVSNTAMVVEGHTPIAWTQPGDLEFDVKKDLPKLGGVFDGAFACLLGDGSVMRVKKDANAVTLKRLIQINDGFVIDLDSIKHEMKK